MKLIQQLQGLSEQSSAIDFSKFVNDSTGQVVNVFQLHDDELFALENDSPNPVWVHAAAKTLGAKNLEDVLFLDTESAETEVEHLVGQLKNKRNIDVTDLGYSLMIAGTLGDKPAVLFSDHGFTALAILK